LIRFAVQAPKGRGLFCVLLGSYTNRLNA
jgi:hypothetical protein